MDFGMADGGTIRLKQANGTKNACSPNQLLSMVLTYHARGSVGLTAWHFARGCRIDCIVP